LADFFASIYSVSDYKVVESHKASFPISIMFFTLQQEQSSPPLLHAECCLSFARSEDSGGPSDSLLPCDSLKVNHC
jgi:hypothetical protein